MLMQKYISLVRQGEDNNFHTVITRLADGTQKYFFQRHGSREGIERFLISMTDELMDSNFPRVDKKGRQTGNTDNWLYLGYGHDRLATEISAESIFIKYRIDKSVQEARNSIDVNLMKNVAAARKSLGWDI